MDETILGAALAEDKTKSKPRRIRDMAWDMIAVALIPLAGFANFITFRGFDPTRPEVSVASAWILLFALAVTAVIALRPDSLRPLVFVILVASFLHMENSFALPHWLSQWLLGIVGPDRLGVISLMIYVLPLAVVFFLLRDKLSVILGVAFGAMTLASFVMPHLPPDAVTVVERDVPPAALVGEKPPPLLHLIVDQQIGIDGLPPEVEGTPQLRQALLRFYRDHGFRLYPGAFTHFPATIESIPDLMNGAVVPSARAFLASRDDKAFLKTNAWFDELKRRGYEIEVVQTDYLDYCGGDDIPISYCATLIASDIRDIAETHLSTVDKATLLLYTYFDEDLSLLARMVRLAWYGLQKGAAKIGVSLPDWNRRSLTLSPIPGVAAIDLVTSRAAEIERGKAIFAHILLPHDPYIFDRDCRLKTDFQTWRPHESALWWHRVKSDPQRRLARYEEYYKQVLCLHKKLGTLLDVLAERGVLDEATIIVHGDHGSRISLIEPISGNEDLIVPRDVVDSVSALYAVRSPNIIPDVVEGQQSIQALFAAFALGKTNIQDNKDFYLKDPKTIVGPQQTRLPLVPFGDD